MGNGNLDALQRVISTRCRQGQNVSEVRCCFVPRGQRSEPPTQLDCLQHRGMINSSALRPEDGTSSDTGRHEERWYPHPEASKIESPLPNRSIRWHCPPRWRNVVIA